MIKMIKIVTFPTAIVYGETLTDNLSIAPEMNVLAFSGNVGDQVIIRIQITSGALDPGLRIYRPDGSALCGDETISDLLEIKSCWWTMACT